MKKRVVVAMSGGVDSSVSALLLKESGWDVIGVSMQLWDYSGGQDVPGVCCSPRDIADARNVASALNIPFYVVNLEEEFCRDVVGYFSREYARGRTPNPCILCNEKIKFRALLARAMELGAGFLATGHYARKAQSADDGTRRLLRGRDAGKDQSYFLFSLTQDMLERALFPVGEMTKMEVRAAARKAGLPVSEKRESQEICFIPQGSLASFLTPLLGRRTGDIVTKDGKTIGHHKGCHMYTIGQRHGLGISSPEALYVTGIDPMGNRVIVAGEKELYSPELIAGPPSWVREDPPSFPFSAEAQIRYRHKAAPCNVYRLDGDRIRVQFEAAQRAVTPGQAVVFYSGEEVLGGAWIDTSA